MRMSIKIELLDEPKLQFGEYFEHEDSKTGLAEFGPFGKNISGLHPPVVKLGFIGTRESIFKAQEWIERCSSYVESENIKTVGKKSSSDGETLFGEDFSLHDPVLKRLSKILNRDFIGFNMDSSFQSSFQLNPRWERVIDPRQLSAALDRQNPADRTWAVVDLLEENLASIAETGPLPDVVIIALTPEMEEVDSVQISGNFYLNLRRAIKARAMRQRNPIPLQLIRWGTLEGKGHIQEVATRAWNFCTALYYKAQGVPWRPVTLQEDTCYLGVSFYIAQESEENVDLTMRSSTALAFDYLGQGLILRGDQFQWNRRLGRSPHLSREAARKLVSRTLEEYVKVRKTPPRRVVIHKTSAFWGHEHTDYNELDGFYEGIEDIYRHCETDFIALRQTGTRLFRQGRYPPLRGTYFTVENTQHFLYTMGYIPYLETSPQAHVPEPWQLTQHLGGSAPKQIFQEILALTKMNVNNCSFADGAPITLSFSQKVGEIMKHVAPDGILQPEYRFYM